MANWSPPQRPAELTEQRLIEAFLNGEFPVGSALPGERTLATQLGVTRPTLREALQRLGRDGWITIQQGKTTKVNDFWWEGNLNVLGAIVRYGNQIPVDFVPNLLDVRLALAPAYAQRSIELAPATVASFLLAYQELTDDPGAFANADWELHCALIRHSKNPIYMLIFNGFSDFYVEMARPYFGRHSARESSRRFYRDLLLAAQDADPKAAFIATQRAMKTSILLWQEVAS